MTQPCPVSTALVFKRHFCSDCWGSGRVVRDFCGRGAHEFDTCPRCRGEGVVFEAVTS